MVFPTIFRGAMEQLQQAEIGGQVVDANNPTALVEHIRFLVRHEHAFVPFQRLLESAVLQKHGDRLFGKFLTLLRRYRAALDEGSVHAEEIRQEIIHFDHPTNPSNG